MKLSHPLAIIRSVAVRNRNQQDTLNQLMETKERIAALETQLATAHRQRVVWRNAALELNRICKDLIETAEKATATNATVRLTADQIRAARDSAEQARQEERLPWPTTVHPATHDEIKRRRQAGITRLEEYANRNQSTPPEGEAS